MNTNDLATGRHLRGSALMPVGPWAGLAAAIALGGLALRAQTAFPTGVLDDANRTWTTSGNANWTSLSNPSRDGSAARSGVIGNNQASVLSTVLTGAGHVRFYWKVSSEHAWDFLKFYVDGSEIASISGEVDWAGYDYDIAGSSTHTLEWKYIKDGSNMAGSDAGYLDSVVFTTTGYTGVLDEQSRVWTSSGSDFWAETTVSRDGSAARSGVIGNNQVSVLSTVLTGAGHVGFYWKVSSEAGYDFLAFYVDGSEIARISGEVDWAGYDYNIAGSSTHTLEWKYFKDSSLAAGSDAGYLDSVVFTTTGYTGVLDHQSKVWTSGGNGFWAQTTVSRDGSAVETPSLQDHQYSYIETTWDGRGLVRFHWAVSSATNSDYLRFTVDGAEVAKISGEVDWTAYAYSIPGGGTHTLRWEYRKDASGSAGGDVGRLDSVQFDTPYPWSGVFDGNALAWCPAGTLPWTTDSTTNRDGRAGRSGAILHAQTSASYTTWNGPVRVQFFWRVSSESDYDFLRFYVDGAEISRISGEVDWTKYTHTVSGAGAHEFRWEYTKDWSISRGADAGWLDSVLFSVSDQPTGFSTALNGYPGLPYVNTSTTAWTTDSSVSYDGQSGRSGVITHNQQTSFAIAEVPGHQMVRWRVLTSCEGGWADVGRFYVDGIEVKSFTGDDPNWTSAASSLGAGVHILMWAYTKNGSASSGSDAVWIDTVTFDHAPIINTHPATPRTVALGNDISFSVAASGTPAPAYQWMKHGLDLADGGRFSGATSASLTITGAQVNDAGDYQVRVYNSYGSVTSLTVGLTVLTPPTIITQPRSQVAGVGEGVTFSVVAAASPPPAYQWRKDGVDLPGQTAAWLWIASATTNEAGVYSVLVTNSIGSATSSEAVLTIVEAPIITQQPAGQTVTQGGDAFLAATAVGALPLSYQWRKDGVDVAGATAPAYGVTGVSTNHAGGYTLVAANSYGAVTSVVAVLTVQAPAYLVTPPQDLTIIQPAPATFTALAGGVPNPTYQWLSNGVVIAGATSPTYTIAHATTNHVADYSVVVANSLATLTSSVARLAVRVPPWIVTPPTDLTFAVGASAQLSVTAAGDPALTYQWQHNDLNLPGATSATLVLANARANQSGQYRVAVLNSYGAITSAPVSVSVLFAPSVARQPASVVAREGSAAVLQVQASGSPLLAYQWFGGWTRIAGGTNAVLTLPRVSRSQFGFYTVTITNVVGSVGSWPAFLSPAANDLLVLGWGDESYGQAAIPGNWTNIVAVDAGAWHTLALTGDGRVLAAGDDSAQQCDVPFNLSNVVAIAAGGSHSLALRDDARVVAWGDNSVGQGDVPANLAGAVAIAAGSDHSLALRADGTVAAWGQNDLGQTSVPAGLDRVIAIDAGRKTSFALRQDGTVVAWGADLGLAGQTNGLQAVAVGASHVLLLGTNGTVVAVGSNTYGQSAVPSSLSNVVAIAAGGEHSLAMTADGRLVAWGAGTNGVTATWPHYGQATLPGSLGGLAAIAAGGEHTVVLRATPPLFLTPLASLQLPAGDRLELSLNLKGSQPMTLQWFKDGAALPGATAASYQVEATTLGDLGSYFLVASNAAGAATSRVATVRIVSPPRLVAQPADVTAVEGTAAGLSAVVEGTAPIALQWRKGGANVEGANTASLAFAPVAAGDAGDYTLVAQNSFGEITSRVAQVTVVAPPRITSSPESQSVVAGAGFGLAATAQGTAPLAYLWSKDGASLAGCTDASFAVMVASTADSGAYQLVVTNLYGAATSQVAQVTVFAPPTMAVTNPPANFSVPSGQGLTLTVTNEGTGPFTYEWRLDGNLIATTQTAEFNLSSLVATDAGEYSVVIGNYAGRTTVVVAQVTVTGPPLITKNPESMVAISGSAVALSVTASGEPPLSYQWRKDGVELSGATNSILPFAAAALGDSGVYQAAVGNPAGTVYSALARLDVADLPGVTEEPQDQTLDEGQDLMLSVTATGTAPLSHQWFQNQQPITGETNSELRVYGLNVAAAGVYTVQISNLAGTASSRAVAVVVRAAPRIATAPSAALLALGGATTLSVQVYGNEPLAFQWFKDGVALTDATNSTLSLANLAVEHVGWYSVLVTNIFGAATNDVLDLRVTGAPVITQQPESVLVIPGGPAVFRVSASSVGETTYQWSKDGATLPGATGAELSLTAVGAGDLGRYQVIVANAGGRTVSQSAALVFHGLPVIQVHPRDLVVYVGETGELFVEAASTLPVTYQWFRNGRPAGQGATNLIVGSGLANVADADLFTVQLSNAVGSVASKPAQVHVRPRLQTVVSGGALITQSLRLEPGWSAVYLDVQPETNTVAEVFGGLPWSSVWCWRNRNRSVQFIQELSEGMPDQSEWLVSFNTNREESFNNNLLRIYAHRPYLVHLDGTEAATLEVTGKPAYLPIKWVPDSYNLTGLPVETDTTTARTFLGNSAAHYDTAADNPRAMFELMADGRWRMLSGGDWLKRNTAYWIYCRGASDFNGGFSLQLSQGTGLDFGSRLNQLDLEFRSQLAEPVFVSVEPFGANPSWPLAVKLLNFQGMQYTALAVPYSFNLAGGGSQAMTLVPQRSRVPDDGFAGVMAARDTRGTLHLLAVEVSRSEAEVSGAGLRARLQVAGSPSEPPVSPYAGLWMGYATLKAVSELNGLITMTNRLSITNALGEVTNIITLSYTNNPMTPAPTPVDSDLDLRLLVHVDRQGQARLLKEVFQLWEDGTRTNTADGYQKDATAGKFVLVTDRRLLDRFRGSAMRDGERVGRRLSSAVFVFDADDAVRNYVEFTGEFQPGGRMTTRFGMSAGAALNPFRHKYNPRHDNLDTSFRVFRAEAYAVTREVTLRFDALPPGKDPAAARNEVAGVYSERVTGLHRKAVATSGDFRLRRISRIDELNPAPTR